jgi:hypothetical protein
MLNLNSFLVDLSNGMNLEDIKRYYKIDNNELKSILVDYNNEINSDNKEEFLFFEEEGNFELLIELGFSNLIGE